MNQAENKESEKNDPQLEKIIVETSHPEEGQMEESSTATSTIEEVVLTEPSETPSEEPLSTESNDEPVEAKPSKTPSEEPSSTELESKVVEESGSKPPVTESVNEEDSDKKTKSKKLSQQETQEEFDALMEKIKTEESFDEKLHLTVDNMEKYLSQGGTPLFKYFWELRKMSLEFFKENISPSIRSSLWPKYSNLSKEARRLKEIFDEQSAFAVEQIDIAITGLEKEIENFEKSIATQNDVKFPFQSKFLDRKKAVYNDIQKRLNLLNAYATRINNLRKELMKTDMRIKHKNKFFQRLSVTGDQVFPSRKGLIKKISDQFLSDVESFLATNFSGDDINGPVFYLREEIKVLQSIAKILTLNTHSFTTTRLRLSECWDKLKIVDKERKKEFAEKKDIFLQNKAEVEEKIQLLSEKFKGGDLSTGSASKQLETIQTFMRKVELGRDEVKSLKASLADVRGLVQGKKKEEEEIRLNEERERLRIRREKLDSVKNEIDDILSGNDSLTVDEFNAKQDELHEKVAQLNDVSGREKLELERSLRQLKDVLSSKQEEALLNLSDDDQQALKNLREVLSQRRQRRKEVKEHYDSLRKASGSSGLDFEQAMLHNDQVNAEKERLDLADTGISEIEKKIREIKSKIK